MAISDFEEWLKQYEPVNDEEAFQLYYALKNEETYGIYTVKTKPSQLFIQAVAGDWLSLLTPKAIEAFKIRIDAYCPDIDMGWEGSEAYQRAMLKSD